MKVIWLIIGFLMGLIVRSLSKKLIHNRAGIDVVLKLYDNKTTVLWGILSAAAYLAIGILAAGNTAKAVENMLVFSICLSLSAVDHEIRKIPNVLLLALIVLKALMLIISRGNFESSIFGMFFAFMVFVFPARFGKTIGMGDIKLAMVIGFYVGVWGFVQAIAIMGICLMFYWAYLYITKKGSLQTSVALGSYISVGFVIAQCVNIPLNL
jgi:prepilin signal peptidase PulO-like enzyme (type II secretory pathway)